MKAGCTCSILRKTVITNGRFEKVPTQFETALIFAITHTQNNKCVRVKLFPNIEQPTESNNLALETILTIQSKDAIELKKTFVWGLTL